MFRKTGYFLLTVAVILLFLLSLTDYDSDSVDLPPRSNLSMPNNHVSLFSHVAPPAAYQPRVKPPLTPRQNGVALHGRRNKKSDRDFNTIRIDVHNQRRGKHRRMEIDVNYVCVR